MDLQGSAQDVGSGGREHGSSTSEASTEQPGPGRHSQAVVSAARGPPARFFLVAKTQTSRRRPRLMGRPSCCSVSEGKTTVEPVWNQPVSGAPDNSSLSHFSATTRPSWLRRAIRNRHRHAIEQATRRWRGGRRGDSARTSREVLISTQRRALGRLRVEGRFQHRGKEARAASFKVDAGRREE